MVEISSLLSIFGVLVAVLVGVLVVVLSFQIARAKRGIRERPELSSANFFGRVSGVSSDVDFYYEGAGFEKYIQLIFKSTDPKDTKPLAVANGSVMTFAKLNRRLETKDTNAELAITLCGKSGAIMLKAHAGEINVRLNRAEIGKISMAKKSITGAEGKSLGAFEKHGMEITGRDVLGLPFVGRRGNFSVKQEVEMHSRTAATITFRKWPDREQPLLDKIDKKLKTEDAAMLFALAAYEWALSVNLRE